jgi:hypothetical protein
MATIAGLTIAAAGVGLSAYSAFNQPDAPEMGGGGPAGSDPYAEMQLEMMGEAQDTIGAASAYDKQLEVRRRQMQQYLGTDAQARGMLDFGVDDATAAAIKAGTLKEGESFRDSFNSNRSWKQLDKQERKNLKIAGYKQKDLKLAQQELYRAFDLVDKGKTEEGLKVKREAEAKLAKMGLSIEVLRDLGEGKKTAAVDLKRKISNELRAGFKDLQSPTAQLVGRRISEARDLQDIHSGTSQRFIHSMIDDPLHELSQAEDEAHDVLALSERESARSARDFTGMQGNMRSFGAEQAVKARSAEKFGTAHALTRQQTAVAKAQVLGDAARYYNQFRTAYADSALAAAENWVNNQSFVRDSFRQLQMTAATALAGVSSMGAQLAAQTGQTAMSIASNERLAAHEAKFAASQAKAQAISGLAGSLMGIGSTVASYGVKTA